MPTPPRALHQPLAPTPHPTPASPLYPHLARISLVLRVYKGCQCVPTPPRALTTPTAHTQPHPGFATTHTWLHFLRAANPCLPPINLKL